MRVFYAFSRNILAISSIYLALTATPTLAQTPVTIEQIDAATASQVFAGYTDIARAYFGARARTSDSSGGDPAENVISFPAGATQEWNALAADSPVDLDIILPGFSAIPIDGFELSGFEAGRSIFEVFISPKGNNGPWQSLGDVSTFAPKSQASEVYANEDQPASQLFRFSRTVTIRALRFRFKKTQFYTYYHLRRVAVFARSSERSAGLPDVVARVSRNLASPDFEGGIIRYPGSDKLAQFLHDGDMEAVWTPPKGRAGSRATLTFMFGEGELVRLDQIELFAPPATSSFLAPKRATISLSLADTPTRNMQQILSVDLAWRAGKAVIVLPKGTQARFVDIALSQAQDDDTPIALTEIRLIESNVPGYQALAVIGRKTSASANTLASQNQPAQNQSAQNQSASDQSASDQEPNDTPAQAQTIVVGTPFIGALWPQTDVDILRLDATSDKPAEFDIAVEALKGVTASFSLAKIVKGTPPRFSFDLPANTAAPTTIAPGEYLLRINRPQNSSIAVVIDDSGSMSAQSSNIYAAFDAFLAAKRPGDTVAIVRFGEQITTLSDFTSDASLLASRLADQLGKSGGSPVYNGLLTAGKLLRARSGDRAIILISDGANSISTSSILDVWSLIEDDSIRFYGLGFGPDLNQYTDYSMPARARRVLDTWARASGGFFAEAPNGTELAQVFAKISEDFRQPSRYSVTTNLRQISFGQLQIGSLGVQIAGENAPLIELILDASGSMRSRKNKVDGALKIDVAKKVLAGLINSLPIGADVGVRVFGQNIREGHEGDCIDIEVIKPYGPVNRQRLIARINAIRPLGTTPIYSALLLAMGDLRDQGGSRKKVVVILTDGKEECEDPGKLPGLAALAQDFGVDLQLNIVGFALADEKTKAILTAASTVTGGQFFDAQDGEALASALRRSFGSLQFDVTAANGEIVAKGRVDGPPIKLRVGIYTVNLLTANGNRAIRFISVEPDLRHVINIVNENGSLGVSASFQPLAVIKRD